MQAHDLPALAGLRIDGARLWNSLMELARIAGDVHIERFRA